MELLRIIRKPFRYQFFNATFVLIGINVVVYLLSLLNDNLFNYFALIPMQSRYASYFWQPLTYMFMHDPYHQSHILFNMIGLFMFGNTLEKRLGSREFLLFYLLTGVLTGILLFFFSSGMTIGASGALFAVLLAYACFFPDTQILLMMVIPVKATIAVLIFIVITTVSLFFSFGGNVSHLGHLGGLVFGFIYLRLRLGIDPVRVFFHK
ncbi:MAG: rhomboid family intramembrane serine protease [Spirochaetales bacterium]|nr:rhomboid family intramembrane serine protease [Spirochaetales bacterium]